MRNFTSILTILLLLMSFIPCADGVADLCAEEVAIADHQHHEEDAEGDDCSPFCYCTCCAGYSTDHCIAQVQAMTPVQSSHHFSFLAAFTQDLSRPVWQPPQLNA